MKRLVLMIAVVAGAACASDEKDTPEQAAKKQRCRALIGHMFEISPETKGKPTPELVAKVPIEDIEQCAAADATVLECLERAVDVAAVKACIPAKK